MSQESKNNSPKSVTESIPELPILKRQRAFIQDLDEETRIDLNSHFQGEGQDMNSIASNQLCDTNYDILNQQPFESETEEHPELLCRTHTIFELAQLVEQEGPRYLEGKRGQYMIIPVFFEDEIFHIIIFDFKTDQFLMTKMERSVFETILGEF